METRQPHPRERYRLLYLNVFTDALGGLPHGMDAADPTTRLAEVCSRAASLPGPGQIRALEAAALARPSPAIRQPRSAPWPRRR